MCFHLLFLILDISVAVVILFWRNMPLIRGRFRTPSPPSPTLPEQLMEEGFEANGQRDSPLSPVPPRPESQASTTLDMDDVAANEQLSSTDSNESQDIIVFPSDDEDYLEAVDAAMKRERVLQSEINMEAKDLQAASTSQRLRSQAVALSPTNDPTTNRIRHEVLEEVARQMEAVFECPVCLEAPRPMTTTMGFCANGHLFCSACTLQLHDQTNNLCPVCRAPHIFISHYNMFVKKMFSILGSFAVYKCEFDYCPFVDVGKDLLIHERFCCFRPVTCPKCEGFGLFANIFWGDHTCFALCDVTKSEPIQLQEGKMLWEFAMDVRGMMDLDTDDIVIGESVRPILLRIDNDTDFRAYVYPQYDIVYNYLVFNVRWLALKAYSDYTVQRLKFKIKVTMSTEYGTMSKGCLVRPLFHCESLTGTDFDGVRMKNHEIRSWLSMANFGEGHLCKECHSAKLINRPHFHILVEMIK